MAADESRAVHRGDPIASHRMAGTGRAIAGMNTDTYEEPVASLPLSSCTRPKLDGSACQAHAGNDGLCVGHRRQVSTRSRD